VSDRSGADFHGRSRLSLLREIRREPVQLLVEADCSPHGLQAASLTSDPRRRFSPTCSPRWADASSDAAPEKQNRLVETLGESHDRETREPGHGALEHRGRHPAAGQIHFAREAARSAVSISPRPRALTHSVSVERIASGWMRSTVSLEVVVVEMARSTG